MQVDARAASEIARAFAPGRGATLRYDGYMSQVDQWTISVRALLPLHRFAVDDEAGTRIYVSEINGTVVMRTTRRERVWAYLGPVVHWLYFTPLRRDTTRWSQVVIGSSLIGCVLCVTGLIWGVWRFSPSSRFRLKRIHNHSPYAGFMKWHHYAGLLFGLATLTWTYSGMLSMEPFGWFSSPGITRAQRVVVSGTPLQLERLSLGSMRDALAIMRGSFAPKGLEAVTFRGEHYWMADVPPPSADAGRYLEAGLLPRAALPAAERRYVSMSHPERGLIAAFDRETMEQIAREVMPGAAIRDAAWLQEYDSYYYDPRGGRGLPILRVRYDDPRETWLYFDAARGAIVYRADRITRLRRWLYNGLHSLDFPFLYYHRPLWDVVVIALSLGGVVLSAVVFVPAWRRLRRHIRSLVARPRDLF
jgi:hypothetical protein